MKPPYTPRNVVGLIGKLIEAHDIVRKEEEDPHSFFDSRREVEEKLIKVENQLEEALKEVLKRP